MLQSLCHAWCNAYLTQGLERTAHNKDMYWLCSKCKECVDRSQHRGAVSQDDVDSQARPELANNPPQTATTSAGTSTSEGDAVPVVTSSSSCCAVS